MKSGISANDVLPDISANDILQRLQFDIEDTLDGGLLEERFLWSWGESKRRAVLNALSRLENAGWITRKTMTIIRLTPKGWKKLDILDVKDGS